MFNFEHTRLLQTQFEKLAQFSHNLKNAMQPPILMVEKLR